MTFLIAAAGTGGHVYPGLAVGEALIELGVPKSDVRFVGGDRMESTVYPEHGFEFTSVELAGLRRSLTFSNLRLPAVVWRARGAIGELIDAKGIRVVLGMGGYVTIPAGMAARSRRVVFFNAEQNAQAGMANKIAARWARASFVSFPHTAGLPDGRWVGNPVRRELRGFDRPSARSEALQRYGLNDGVTTVGVFGGSLGAKSINEAVAAMAGAWTGGPIQMIHLTGAAHIDDMGSRPSAAGVHWVRRGFEDDMPGFYAVSDLVVARAGGAVSELTATGSASLLVPGDFGSGSHQAENARYLAEAGAAVILEQSALGDLGSVVGDLISSPDRLESMRAASAGLAKPDAAVTIARSMIEAAG